MELNKINSDSNWGKAASDINQNFEKLGVDITKVKNATTNNKGYFDTLVELKTMFPYGASNQIAYVGKSYPYAIYKWDGSKWYDTNQKGGDESIDLNSYYPKIEVDAKLANQEAKLSELGSKQHNLPSCTFIGKGSDFSEGENYVDGILQNVPLKLHISNIGISMDEVNNGLRLQVHLVNTGTGEERTVLALQHTEALSSYYVITPRTGEDRMRIGGRCAKGEVFKIFVEQETTFQQNTYISNKRLVNNNSATEYPSEGDGIFGYFRLDGGDLSVENVVGSVNTAACVFYDSDFNVLGVYNENNNGSQNIFISYNDITSLFPNAIYVRFSSNKPNQFIINSGIDTVAISSELTRYVKTNINKIDSFMRENRDKIQAIESELLSRELKFSIPSNTSHSSTSNMIYCSIDEGEGYSVEYECDDNSSGATLYIYYKDGTNVAKYKLSPSENRQFVAEKDIVALGLYIASTSLDRNVSFKVVWGELNRAIDSIIPYISNMRLVNNATATEYASEGDRIFGLFKLDKTTLSVSNVIGTSNTAASAFYDANFNIIGVYNTTNDGLQDINISYEDIIALFPGATYVKFTSQDGRIFRINSGVSTIVFPNDLIKKTIDNKREIDVLNLIAKTNIVISDSLDNSYHNIYVDAINKKVVIKKGGFILRAFGKWVILNSEDDYELSYRREDASNGAYIIPRSIIENAKNQDTIILSSDIIQYVSRYSSLYNTEIVLFTTYYGTLVAEGLFESAIKVGGKEVLENAFTGAYIEEDVHPIVKKYCALFDNTNKIEAFCFFTDPHLVGADNLFDSETKYKYQHYLGTLQKFYNSCPTDFLVCGGDWLINNDTNEVACYKLGYIDTTMRKLFKNYYPVVGNHDYNYLGNNNDVDLTESTLRNLWLRGYEHTYYEFKGHNSRCFALDCETDHAPAMNDFKWGQIEWLGERLKENTDEHIILFMHIYKQGSPNLYTPPFALNVQDIAVAFNSRTFIWLNDIKYDFSNVTKGKIHCIIAGHMHEDAIYADEGVPVFMTTTFGDSKVPTFDMILIDYDNNKLHSVRVGDGEDRQMDLA